MCRSWAVFEGLGAWKRYFALYKQDNKFLGLEIFFSFQTCKKAAWISLNSLDRFRI